MNYAIEENHLDIVKFLYSIRDNYIISNRSLNIASNSSNSEVIAFLSSINAI